MDPLLSKKNWGFVKSKQREIATEEKTRIKKTRTPYGHCKETTRLRKVDKSGERDVESMGRPQVKSACGGSEQKTLSFGKTERSGKCGRFRAGSRLDRSRKQGP